MFSFSTTKRSLTFLMEPSRMFVDTLMLLTEKKTRKLDTLLGRTKQTTMPFAPNHIRREEAGSLTLPAPTMPRLSGSEKAQKEVLECGGNAQLMEARLCQTTSSIRALIRSNQDLEAALQSDPNDPDFLQAVAENRLALRRQYLVAVALVKALQAHGASVELEEDIRQAINAFNEELAAPSSSEAAAEVQGETQQSNHDDVFSQGVYL
jgi:hypothetical protein